MKYSDSPDLARRLDRQDKLRSFRKLFHLPVLKGKPCIYFAGHSLGLQPGSAGKFIKEELDDWARLGVEGHFHSRRPWLYYHKFGKKALASLAGARISEVVAMNQLTVNLHLMLVSFYRPVGRRCKILVEAGAFSSDQYAFESQVRLHALLSGQSAVDGSVIIALSPRTGEFVLRTEDILAAIQQHREDLALVFLGAVQYYTGQFFDIRAITTAAHQAGATVGFDLAHAIGNVPLHLHRDGVDFAVWCGYKYLNGGPGGVAGAFIHNFHATRSDLPRLAGWWGHDEQRRFEMTNAFSPMPGVDGWQLSNFPVLSGAVQLASLEIFQRAGMQALRTKSIMLTGYLEFLLKATGSPAFTVITPADAGARGCQLSILMHRHGKKVFDFLTRHGVVADWREPDVIRVAPVPLYNTFGEVYRFVGIFKEACLRYAE